MNTKDELDLLRERRELDFRTGVRGKHYAQAMSAKNVVILDADLLEVFPDSDAVNSALRSLRDIARRTGVPGKTAA